MRNWPWVLPSWTALSSLNRWGQSGLSVKLLRNYPVESQLAWHLWLGTMAKLLHCFTLESSKQIKLFIYLVCVHVCVCVCVCVYVCVCVCHVPCAMCHVPQHECGAQGKAYRCHFFLFITCVLGMEFRSLGLAAGIYYPLSHLAGPPSDSLQRMGDKSVKSEC